MKYEPHPKCKGPFKDSQRKCKYCVMKLNSDSRDTFVYPIPHIPVRFSCYSLKDKKKLFARKPIYY